MQGSKIADEWIIGHRGEEDLGLGQLWLGSQMPEKETVEGVQSWRWPGGCLCREQLEQGVGQDRSEGGDRETEIRSGCGKDHLQVTEVLKIMACAVIQGIKSSGEEGK